MKEICLKCITHFPIFLKKMLTLSDDSGSCGHQFLCLLYSDVLRNDINLCFPGCQGVGILLSLLYSFLCPAFRLTLFISCCCQYYRSVCLSCTCYVWMQRNQKSVTLARVNRCRESTGCTSVKCMSISKYIYFPTLIFQLRSICFLSGSQLPSGLSLASHHSDDYCSQ